MKILREIVRNTSMGSQAIDNIFNYIDCDKLKNVVYDQKKTLEDYLSKARTELGDEEFENAKSNPVQRAMAKAGVKMNASFDSSSSHLASMLIDGYNLGITSVQKCINEMKRDGVEIPELAYSLMQTYDDNIRELREFL